ncbi:YcnI family protein [Parvibaculum sp.]|uniref:YcnI family copper-binding membrane protein n=1 Tax=Parvibaculum sp. TaxID=2024848 RepID=UPI002730A528|nr:YcnI family protein [Parvibaculum sp.]MDP1626874.1 YcnI family protein [Parvibaculum sp.]MDP2148520.1 YcnI family protein [Parvibaculum sp.]MDP3329311.1 YcnI family protein [Parvibaculum sp.]
MKNLSIALCAAAIFAAAAPASAHVTLGQESAPAGSYYKAVFRVPHGCAGSATTSVSIRVPEGVISVKPQPKPGWTVATEKAAYTQTYEVHGKPVSEGVVKVTWQGGPLPDDQFDEFAFLAKLPSDPEAMMLFFPVEQTCEKGSIAWDEFAAPGVDPHSLEKPAPALMLIHGEGHEHHH